MLRDTMLSRLQQKQKHSPGITLIPSKPLIGLYGDFVTHIVVWWDGVVLHKVANVQAKYPKATTNISIKLRKIFQTKFAVNFTNLLKTLSSNFNKFFVCCAGFLLRTLFLRQQLMWAAVLQSVALSVLCLSLLSGSQSMLA